MNMNEKNKIENCRIEPKLKLINMDSVEVEQVEWLLYPFIPYGKVTIIQGDPGEGKTTMVLQIIAKLTRGEPILPVTDKTKTKEKRSDEVDSENEDLDAEDNMQEQSSVSPVNVIYQTAEDGLGDTIKPRLLAAGADCSKVLVIDDSDQPLTMADGQEVEVTLFEQVKECVTARQAAEHYGIKVKRNGMACCPFHKDRHPSMKADKIYHCFACGVGGDAIDFTARLFGISQYEAAKKLIEDFGLDIKVEDRNKYKRTHQSRNILISKKPKVVMIREKLEQWLKHATDVLIRYLKWIQFWKEIYKPEPEEEWHELFTEALANERKINDYLDVLMFGTGEEIVEFFKIKRREVEKIEERINEYQREVLDGIRRYCE